MSLVGFVYCRVSPLQLRAHLIREMHNRHDHCRMSIKDLPTVEMVRHVNYFSNSQLNKVEWRFSKPLYNGANPSPVVSVWCPYFLRLFSSSALTTRTWRSALLARR